MTISVDWLVALLAASVWLSGAAVGLWWARRGQRGGDRRLRG